jgi:two-component system sensor histidine kinase KdpD
VKETMKIAQLLLNEVRVPPLRFIGESLAGVWIIALLTFAGYELHFNPAPVGFLFLLVIVVEAILSGFWQASAVSVVACLCLDYFFYPPVLTLNIYDPQDWIALGAFEISALLVSRLSSRERHITLEAKLQRTAMEQLYELSRSTLLINLHQPAEPQLTQLILRIFPVEAVAIFSVNAGRSDLCGAWTENERELAKECYLLQVDDEDRLTRTSRRLLRSGVDPIGAIAIRGNLGPLVTNALASLAAITLDRCVTFEKESLIEAAHQSERLRTAVLDSLAHEIRTPITAIQTAHEGLLEVGQLNPPQTQLVGLIESETAKLSTLCTRLLQTARLEAETMTAAKDEIVVEELVSETLQKRSGRMAGHKVLVEVADPGLAVRGDRDMLAMALMQYLDNAAKYSYPGSAVKIAARESHSEILISVHNFGPSIPIADREKIFQRFYRSEGASRMAEGTGIGLSTVKMAADAHHGHVWVISDKREGTTFFLSLPKLGIRGI